MQQKLHVTIDTRKNAKKSGYGPSPGTFMGIAAFNAFWIRLPAKKSIYLLRALATLATPIQFEKK